MALMSSSELGELIVGYLVIGKGGPARRWRDIVGKVIVHTDADHTNWRINPQVRPAELVSVLIAEKMAREDVPYVES